MMAFLRFGFLKVVLGCCFGWVIIEVCLSSRTQAPTSVADDFWVIAAS